jgi:histidinol-phosphate phosphatase family protein
LPDRDAVIFDLCGTLGEDDGDIRSFRLYPCAAPALRLLAEAAVPAVVLTNQSRISKGGFTQQGFDRVMAWVEREMGDMGVRWPKVYCCPHADSDGCACRKPKPGMARQAAQDLGVDLSRCFVVGDSGGNDMLLARAIGAKGVLVRTGWGEGSLREYRHLWADVEADHIAEDALAAVKWILSRRFAADSGRWRTREIGDGHP